MIREKRNCTLIFLFYARLACIPQCIHFNNFPSKKSTAKGKPKCKKIAHLVYLGYFCGILDHCERKYVPN